MLVKEIKEHLINDMIPFWEGMQDEEYGGFYGKLDFDLILDKKAEKGCILNSRILWFFSNVYQELQDESLLRCADHAYAFLVNHCLDQENGGVYWSLNYDGTVMDGTKHTYNQAFAIYALSSYYAATKEENAVKTAFDLFSVIEKKCRDSIGYLEAFDVHFKPVDNDKLSENGVMAVRTMNTLLHVFEAYTELYQVTKEQSVGRKMKEILDVISEHVFNPVKRRQEVFFDHNINSMLDLHSYGHDIEAAWLIDRGCEVLDDEEYINKMRKITDILNEEVYRSAFDGKSLACECDKGIVKSARVWWVQAEAMVGFMNAYEKDKSKSCYLDAVKKLWLFIQENLIDKRKGSEWFWDVDSKGNPTSKRPIVSPWKCPYHNGRMCLEIIRRAEHAS
jgi:mannobiose 2-epimerase